MQIAVIGASGVVGSEIVTLLKKRNFPMQTLRLFARAHFETLSEDALKTIDLAFFAAGSSVSREWIPKTKALCIDSSSAFRETEPLIIPEINGHALEGHRGILCSPNCAATILSMPLAPLHRLYRAKRVIVSTYQAASGGGAQLMKRLEEETRLALQGVPLSASPPYAFNLFPHTSELHESGYVGEELKLRDETRKILEDPTLALSATCVRVPILRAHSIAANVEFHRPIDLEEAVSAVKAMPGVLLFEDRANNRFATPADATGRDEIFCGRFRLDPTQPNTLEFWAVGDQLLKGAALNAVQIAEHILAHKE